MLLKPRRLPQRFNRSVTAQTRLLAERRHRRRRAYVWERWQRAFYRIRSTFGLWRKRCGRYALLSLPVCAVVALGVVLFSPVFMVREVRVLRGNPRLDIELVQEVLSPLFGRHILFLPAEEVERLLKERIPDVQEVKVGKRYSGELTVGITLEPLIARLIVASPDQPADTAAGSGSVTVEYLTAGGRYVSAPGAEFEGKDLPLIEMVDWGARPLAGSILLTPEFLGAVRGAENALVSQFGKDVSERLVFLRAREFHLRMESAALWFDLKSSVEEQLQRYRIFLKAVGPEEAKEYVDLRLADRVVYR